MLAAVCYAFGEPLVVEEVVLDPPKVGEVKVRMVATAICHSDIHLLRGEWGGQLPVIAGHESAGIVVEVGPGVTMVAPGDHVVVSLLRSCGRCKMCVRGNPHLCSGTFALNTETRLHTREGQPVTQGIRTAGFAEYTVVDQSQLVKVPEAMSLETASLLACGVITGLGAVVKRAAVPAGSSVVVIGTGGVGLNAVQGAKLAGAHPIIAVDLLDSKLEDAQEFGATHAINGAREDVKARIGELTEGAMADYAFVTVGSAKAAEQAYSLVGTRGHIVFVGIPDFAATIPLPVGLTILSEKTVTGSFMGSVQLSEDVPMLVDLYVNDKLKLDELITARYPLSQINEAIASTEAGAALRNVIVF